jgi:hypothetical protein
MYHRQADLSAPFAQSAHNRETQAAAPGNLGGGLDHVSCVLDTTEARCMQANLHPLGYFRYSQCDASF